MTILIVVVVVVSVDEVVLMLEISGSFVDVEVEDVALEEEIDVPSLWSDCKCFFVWRFLRAGCFVDYLTESLLFLWLLLVIDNSIRLFGIHWLFRCGTQTATDASDLKVTLSLSLCFSGSFVSLS